MASSNTWVMIYRIDISRKQRRTRPFSRAVVRAPTAVADRAGTIRVCAATPTTCWPAGPCCATTGAAPSSSRTSATPIPSCCAPPATWESGPSRPAHLRARALRYLSTCTRRPQGGHGLCVSGSTSWRSSVRATTSSPLRVESASTARGTTSAAASSTAAATRAEGSASIESSRDGSDGRCGYARRTTAPQLHLVADPVYESAVGGVVAQVDAAHRQQLVVVGAAQFSQAAPSWDHGTGRRKRIRRAAGAHGALDVRIA